MYGDLSGHGAEDVALDAVNITDVGLLEVGIIIVPDGVPGNIDLNPTLEILNIHEGGLTHDPLEHHAAGDRNADGVCIEQGPPFIVGFLLRLAQGAFLFLVLRIRSSCGFKVTEVRRCVILQDLRFLGLIQGLHFVRVMGLVVLRDLKGILAGVLQGLKLVPADLQQLIDVLILLFCHKINFFLKSFCFRTSESLFLSRFSLP